jgi:hypothetical protein
MRYLKHHEEGDPWQTLFQIASQNKSNGYSDLVPYWVFEDGSARIERRIPLLPFSKEVGKAQTIEAGLGALSNGVWSTPSGRSAVQPESKRQP